MNTIDVLRQMVIDQFQEHWKLNDGGHREEHFERVFQTGLVINERLGCGFDPRLILFAAYFHDLFAWSRVNHHVLSYTWMLTTDHPLIVNNLDQTERVMVAQACHEHRASYEAMFTCKFSELFNAADREMPGDVEHMIKRGIQYRLKRDPDATPEERLADTYKHLKEKFGVGGYARYNQLYLDCFGEELRMQQEAVMALGA